MRLYCGAVKKTVSDETDFAAKRIVGEGKREEGRADMNLNADGLGVSGKREKKRKGRERFHNRSAPSP